MFSMMDITSPRFTDDHWVQYHGLLRKLQERYKSTFRDIPWPDMKKAMLSEVTREPCFLRAVITARNVIVGWMSLRAFNYGRPEQMVLSECNALYDEIPEALRKSIARQFTEWLEQRGLKETFMVAYSKRITDVAAAWGGRQLNELNEFVLYRNRADQNLLRTWLETVPRMNEKIQLEFYQELPEFYLKDMAALLTELLRDMPEEGDSGMNYNITVEEMKKQMLWRRENKIPSFKTVLFNEKNEPVGVSFAEVSLANPRIAVQAMTGVRQDYRRQGLTRWMKAVMFFKLGEKFPVNEKFVTMMRSINEPMQKINRQMGYVLERQGAEFKIKLESFKKYLDE